MDEYASTYNYVFGHSSKLADKCGYWVFVIMLGSSVGRYAQLAIGSIGSATRFYDNSAWSDWV